MSKLTTPEKAFNILKKNLNVWQLKDLIVLLEHEVEKQSQELMAESL